jgi:hypothetical protein
VDVASQVVGAQGPAAGGEAGSRSIALQAEMKHFEHEAFGAEEERARNNVQNDLVMANQHLQAHVESAHADTVGIVIMVGHEHQHYHQHQYSRRTPPQWVLDT